MHVQLGARGAVSLDGLAAAVGHQLLEAVKDVLRDQAALFNPSLGTLIGADTNETPDAFEDLDAVAVVHGGDFVVHGGNAIAEAGLDGRHVHVLVLSDNLAALAGGGDEQQECRQDRQNSEGIRARTIQQHDISL